MQLLELKAFEDWKITEGMKGVNEDAAVGTFFQFLIDQILNVKVNFESLQEQ